MYYDRRLNVMNSLSTYLEKYLSRKYLNWKIPAEWVAGSAEWVAGSVRLGIFSDFWRGAGRARQKLKKMFKQFWRKFGRHFCRKIDGNVRQISAKL